MKAPLLFRRIFARFMRAFFYLLYQPMAWSYDLVASAVSWGRWKDWVLAVLPYLKGPHILEIGHGPGHLQIALRQKEISPFGIDASRQMGRQASQLISKQGYEPQLTRAYAQKFPFPQDSFDQIVTTFPTGYIYALETLLEAYRTLKPGGTLLVLPAVWITGKRPADRGTAALFRITGQSPAWDRDWLSPFTNAGFYAQVERITRKTWALVIITAQKPPRR